MHTSKNNSAISLGKRNQSLLRYTSIAVSRSKLVMFVMRDKHVHMSHTSLLSCDPYVRWRKQSTMRDMFVNDDWQQSDESETRTTPSLVRMCSRTKLSDVARRRDAPLALTLTLSLLSVVRGCLYKSRENGKK